MKEHRGSIIQYVNKKQEVSDSGLFHRPGKSAGESPREFESRHLRILIESPTSPFNPLTLAHWGLLKNHQKRQYSQHSPVE